MSLKDKIHQMADVDIFSEARNEDLFIGRPYYLDYDKAYLLIADSWKQKVEGVPQGAFLLAFYENEHDDVEECLLLRALGPAKLPTDNDVIASMVEYYKDNLDTSGSKNQLDQYTRYTFSFSGLECRVLGTFYKDAELGLLFGADVENFYSANNYSVYKPNGQALEKIINFRDGKTVPGCSTDVRIGKVRYSSSLRFQNISEEVPVYVSPKDFIGKRTATFGMTRTGKSNTVKKIIEATTEISESAENTIESGFEMEDITELLKPYDDNGKPKFKVGQIIFDMNGEYANKNLQDEGTAISDMFKDITERYSVLEKEGFKVMKTNFYEDINAGFELIKSYLTEEKGSDYVKSFVSVDFNEPGKGDRSAYTRWERQVAAYKCCLYKAGFKPSRNYKIRFPGNGEINDSCKIYPDRGISLDKACMWFTWIFENEGHDFFIKYKENKGKDWVDEELKSILVFLARKKSSRGLGNLSGYKLLNPLTKYHTNTTTTSFSDDIICHLRDGGIVIIDLSQGSPIIQKTYSEKICNNIFNDAMDRFINMKPNNFIQFYFEEAHNLFPKKDDKDLSQIYNRIAKEGAKLNLGVLYATQEVSSISSNILKNTQNWFIAHLNNEDEIKEIKKFYDFNDFCRGLVKYSSGSDKGFVRMKTYSNAFIVPVQIDRFSVKQV